MNALRFIVFCLVLAGGVLGAASVRAEGDFPTDKAVKIGRMEGENLVYAQLPEGHLHVRGDEAMVYLRTEYQSSSIFIPVGWGRIQSFSEGGCIVMLLETSDEISTANWLVPDQSRLAERRAELDRVLGQARQLASGGDRAGALRVVDEALAGDLPADQLRELRQNLDLSSAKTPDGLTYEQLVADPSLRDTLRQPEYLNVMIGIMNKDDWASPEERLWLIRSLPGKSPEQLEELAVVL